MILYNKLQQVSSEEDVKDLYIKSSLIKHVQKNLIDIQTKEVWFEAKDRECVYLCDVYSAFALCTSCLK